MGPPYQFASEERATMNKTSSVDFAEIVTNGSLKHVRQKGSG